jgi:hypothetical protein
MSGSGSSYGAIRTGSSLRDVEPGGSNLSSAFKASFVEKLCSGLLAVLVDEFDDPCGPPGPAPNDSRPGRSQRAQAWARAVFHLADVTGLLAATWVAMVSWSSRWSTSDCSSSPIRYPLGPRPDL